MKKICEIYDISREYNVSENTILMCVSDLEKSELFGIIPELKYEFNDVMDTISWQKYLEINKIYNRIESKHHMREIRQSKKVEVDTMARYDTDNIGEILNNSDLKARIEYALSQLKPLPRRRFLKHYAEGYTYREIASEENRSVSTIYESIKTARKKFLDNFDIIL